MNIRIAFININQWARKESEIIEWLHQEEAQGSPVHALMIAEPVITADYHFAHEKYALTAETTTTKLSKNPHLDTRALYRHTDETQTIVEVTSEIEPRHRGITWIKLFTKESIGSDLYVAAVYVPNVNKSNPIEYVEALLAALGEQVAALSCGRNAVMIMADINCPHKAPFQPSSKTPVLNLVNNFLTNNCLTNMNWTQQCTGFFTFFKNGKQSQLDFVFANAAAKKAMVCMKIDKTTNFTSDHVILDTRLSSRKQPKRQQLNQGKKKQFEWDENSCKIPYHQQLRKNTAVSKASIEEAVEKHRNQTNKNDRYKATLQTNIDEIVTNLTKQIVESYEATVPSPALPPSSGKKAQIPHENNHLFKLIKIREDARARVHQAQGENSGSELTKNLKEEHLAAVIAVRNFLNNKKDDKLKAQLKSLNAAYKSKDKDLFKKYAEIQREPRVPLPPTLIVDGREIRRVNLMDKCWNERFNIDHQDLGGPKEQKVREKISQLNATYELNTFHDEGSPGVDFSLIDPFDEEDYKDVLKKLESNKSGGEDEITHEMIKRGGEVMMLVLLALLNLLLLTELIPTSWKLATLVPVYKAGHRQFPKNYRPIGLLSVIYKFYERLLDMKMRRILKLPPEQCGFRAEFSTYTTLLRMDIFIRYCKERNINFAIVAADFQEAFERAWRPGILFRLWEAGVRGKVWRIVKNMLTGTKAQVRTNYGKTKIFNTVQGVVQGSVLAALFFILLVNPLIKALKHTAPSIGGIRINAQLFADDTTLPATSLNQSAEQLGVCFAWANRWNMIIKEIKTHLMTLFPNGESFEIQGMIFKEVATLRLLGIAMDRNGVCANTQAQILSRKLAVATKRLLSITTTDESVQLGLALFLYRALALSICAYSLPHAPNSPITLSKISKKQVLILRMITRTGDNADEHCLNSELGVLSLTLEAWSRRLLCLHKAINNNQDPLTKKLLELQITPGDESSTEIQAAAKLLDKIGVKMNIRALFKIQYDEAKTIIQTAAKGRMRLDWERRTELGNAAQVRLGRIKPSWGVDDLFLTIQVHLLSPYLQLRIGSYNPPMSEGKCSHCLTGLPDYHHLLFECPATANCRKNFHRDLELKLPSLVGELREMIDLDRSSAEEYVLGAAKQLLPITSWNILAQATIRLAHEIISPNN